MIVPVGYSNNVEDGRVTGVVEVYQFTPAQLEVRKFAKGLETKIADTGARRDLARLRELCDHAVFSDSKDLSYMTRTCEICGHQIGVI